MKIYYSKYIGYGSLAFACALFVHLAFLSVLGFEGVPKVSFVTLIQILLLLIAIYATIAGIKRLTSRQIAFELTSDGIYAYQGVILTKDIFIPKDNLVTAAYKVADVSDPDHQNSKSYFIEFQLRDNTTLENLSKSNIIIDPEHHTVKVFVNLCKFKEKEWQDLSKYLTEEYRITVL
ncbi:hypothetical protein [Streptococcus sp. HMSC072G04]|uniref:hypothetical protein n=1 Tax=Streptococcus TaxID=1301 RepID=UPI0008A5E1CA|nr:hypothetical protein [Streptococcus sp. HMSC072G04]OFR18012.1 hypothetical protein HMPREF2904_06235 [Streptococcus sp. HMSC072G04]